MMNRWSSEKTQKKRVSIDGRTGAWCGKVAADGGRSCVRSGGSAERVIVVSSPQKSCVSGKKKTNSRRREITVRVIRNENCSRDSWIVDYAQDAKAMADYLEQFRALSVEEAAREAKKALCRSGITTKSGKIKKNIVTEW